MKRILNYPGSKWKMADWIIEHMPNHETYLEPFFGSGAVYFNKPLSAVETINDIDGRLVNMFRVMRDFPNQLAAKVELTPYSRAEYDLSFEVAADPIEDARRMLARCWFAIGGKTVSKSGWRCLISSNGPRVVADWNKIPDRIKLVSNRLKNTQIECFNALDLIKRYNRPEVLIYADPPYVMDTRTSKHYQYEMSNDEHCSLLEVLKDHKGPVLLSGYTHELYSEKLKDWTLIKKDSTALGGAKRIESLWINPIAAEQMTQFNLFELEI
ncbi:DNA adenine methylase [Heyndrickxia oleronia]|uniref:DNA adenine methylase n=1 Tax=Heyndrickxia oleronia TaxID=38875 RepID=UPI001B1042D2|nr:DNA adenine methylase [Heyndrickxia oleronia]GIN38482.1 DNA methyltransferase [Heyndrickxia oleronia]